MKRFIFTGAPSSGKTSVIKELEKLGHIIIHEAATDVIAAEQAYGIERPWEQQDFGDKIIAMQQQRQLQATGKLQFYDRSPFCTYTLGQYLAHLQNLSFIPSTILLAEIDRCLKNNIYQNKVFFFENLGFIEHTDARQITYKEALVFEKMHFDVYSKFGFEITLIPKNTIAKRCDKIISTI